MRLRLQIAIRKVDNGFTIVTQSDTPGENSTKIAKDEEEAKATANEIISKALTKPASPDA